MKMDLFLPIHRKRIVASRFQSKTVQLPSQALDNRQRKLLTGNTVSFCFVLRQQALGSYRRGKADSGDCDVLLTHEDGVSETGFRSTFLSKNDHFARADSGQT
jgi:hypothetical protein